MAWLQTHDFHAKITHLPKGSNATSLFNSYPVLCYFNFVENAITVTLNQMNNSFDFLFVIAWLQIKKIWRSHFRVYR